MKNNDVLLRIASQIIVFISLIFGADSFFSGHNLPGGGFIGGLIIVSAFALLAIAYDLNLVKRILPFNPLRLAGSGLLIILISSSISLFKGQSFLTHSSVYVDLPLFGHTGLYTSTLFDIGVLMVVLGAILTIILAIGESD